MSMWVSNMTLLTVDSCCVADHMLRQDLYDMAICLHAHGCNRCTIGKPKSLPLPMHWRSTGICMFLKATELLLSAHIWQGLQLHVQLLWLEAAFESGIDEVAARTCVPDPLLCVDTHALSATRLVCC